MAKRHDNKCKGEFSHAKENTRRCYLCKHMHECLVETHDKDGEIS